MASKKVEHVLGLRRSNAAKPNTPNAIASTTDAHRHHSRSENRMSKPSDGPLPQWTEVGGIGSGVFEATAPDGIVWLLVAEEAQGDQRVRAWLLSPRDVLSDVDIITAEHGLHRALDMAGLRIASEAVRRDPEGARRQLKLDD
jgi:hypothetical protein